MAATRAIAETNYKPAITALIDRLFDPKLTRVAQVRAEAFASAFDWAGPGAAGRDTSHPFNLCYGHGELGRVSLSPATNLLGQLKALPDDKLAPLMAASLERIGQSGGLAHVPDIYYAILCIQFLDLHSGAFPETAGVLLEQARKTAPRDSAAEDRAIQHMISALDDRAQYEEALALQEHRLRVAKRRALENESGLRLARITTYRDVLRATVLATKGKKAEARALFGTVLLTSPRDPVTLNYVAWYLLQSDLDLGVAEDLARRAVRLERRALGNVTLNLADTYACILLARGRPEEGLDFLAREMRSMSEPSNASFHLHLAQLLTAVGEFTKAERALVDALKIDRRLADRIGNDKYLKPLRPRFPALVRRATQERDQGF